MTDSLGWRKKFAVLIPSTNTSVQPEFDGMRPPGVTNHISRIRIPNIPLNNDADFSRLIELIAGAQMEAVDSAMSCEPDLLVLGISAETFWDGYAASKKLKAELEAHTKLAVSMGSDAVETALKLFGAKRLGVVTPYQPVGDDQVVNYFKEIGIETVRVTGLKAPSATGIAAIDEPTLIRTLRDELDGDDIDGIFQAGTNMSMVRLADEAERWLGKPVVAINAATMWHSLRENGFTDQMDGFGTLLRDH